MEWTLNQLNNKISALKHSAKYKEQQINKLWDSHNDTSKSTSNTTHSKNKHLTTAMNAENINMSFDNRKVIDNVYFGFEKGKVYGLIGPNGAGKTTLIKILMSALNSDSGNVTMDGKPIQNSKSLERISYFPEKERFVKGKTVSQYYDFLYSQDWHKLRNWKKEFKKMMDFFPSYNIRLNSKPTSLSSGMQKIVMFVSILIEDRELLILDEPAENMDFLSRTTMFKLLDREAKKGKTIIISSHNLKEVRDHLDIGIFISQGKIEKVVDLTDKTIDLEKTYNDVFWSKNQ